MSVLYSEESVLERYMYVLERYTAYYGIREIYVLEKCSSYFVTISKIQHTTYRRISARVREVSVLVRSLY